MTTKEVIQLYIGDYQVFHRVGHENSYGIKFNEIFKPMPIIKISESDLMTFENLHQFISKKFNKTWNGSYYLKNKTGCLLGFTKRNDNIIYEEHTKTRFADLYKISMLGYKKIPFGKPLKIVNQKRKKK